MIKPSSISAKIILLILFVATLALTNIVMIYRKQIQDAELRHEQNIATLIDYLRIPVEDAIFTGNITNLERLANRTIASGAISAIVIEYPDGKHIASYPEKIDYTKPASEVEVYQSFDNVDFALEAGPKSKPSQKPIGSMIVYLNDTDEVNSRNALKFDLVVSSVIILLLVGLVYFCIRVFFIKPLAHVFQSAASILDARYDDVVALSQSDEIGDLSNYLKKIADDFSTRDKLQKGQLREIINTNAELTRFQKEKNEVMDRLLDGVTPSLQEAMSTITFLQDKPSVQANLTKSILFALGRTEETRAILAAHSKRISSAPEKIGVSEFFELTAEYINFFSEKNNVPIFLKMDRPLEFSKYFLIIDKQKMMRFFAHIFDLVNSRSLVPTTVSILIMFSKVSADEITIDLIVRESNHEVTDKTCSLINVFFAGQGKDQDVSDLKNSFEYSQQPGHYIFTLINLKHLLSVSKARYAILRSGSNEVIHNFSFNIYASEDAIKIETRIKDILNSTIQDLCVIGANHFIKQIMHRHYSQTEHIKFMSYELASSMIFKPDTHYIVDLINDRAQGLSISKRIVATRSNTHNLAAVVSSNDSRKNSLIAWCDVDFDMFFYDAISDDDLQKIISRKHVSDTKQAMSAIMNQIQRPEST